MMLWMYVTEILRKNDNDQLVSDNKYLLHKGTSCINKVTKPSP